MKPRTELHVEMVPIDSITVVNPRGRGRHKFREIVANISRLGLKRPITVAKRNGRNGRPHYDLVCGQGRLEAYKALGQTQVQAVVVEADKEELMLMSLTENLARRVRSSSEMMQSIVALKEAGDSFQEIARKTDLDPAYVKGILRLMSKGEDRLIRAVERGVIPISVAMAITSSDDTEVQRVLTAAYEANTLRGKQLIRARRILEQRRRLGKARAGNRAPKGKRDEASQLLAAYREESAAERLLVRQARICESRLLFVVSALRQMLQDEVFVKVIRGEGLDVMPQYLADQMHAGGKS
jgi:ParB family chromosome partitioning protein